MPDILKNVDMQKTCVLRENPDDAGFIISDSEFFFKLPANIRITILKALCNIRQFLLRQDQAQRR